MSSRLYPRLIPGAAARRFHDLQISGPQPPRDGEDPSLADAVFAATGGTRVVGLELTKVRRELLGHATEHGFPGRGLRAGYARFDSAVARYLHGMCGLSAGEAAQRAVWSYFGLVLVPDVCAWRFPAKEVRGFLDDRFIGADLTRHTLSRLWLRAHLLHEPGARNPYALVDIMGEAAFDQVLTRREDIAATPALVREIVRAHRDDPGSDGGPSERELLRDSLKRLMRLAAFIDLDSLSPQQLSKLVREARGLSRTALATT